jgi:aspartyl aminopeptidase
VPMARAHRDTVRAATLQFSCSSWPLFALVCATLACTFARVSPAHAQSGSERLGHQPTVWERQGGADKTRDVMAFGDAYRHFLGAYKTEREVVAAVLELAAKRGFRDFMAEKRPAVKTGSKLVVTRHGKLLALVVVGEKPVTDGVHVVAAHIDAVHIDLKQKPLYADGNVAWFETQYYGGIKAYQWLSQPLELRGVVVKKNGQSVDIAIGDDPEEPVLIIPDIAIHISHHVDRREGEEVPGEALDPIVSSTPAKNPPAGRDTFAVQAERLLSAQYGVDVSDLLAAELELVPAARPRDVGIDRALVGGYGQDDRACSYAAVRAILDMRTPAHTAIVMLLDKEEIGSHGNTGAQSNFMRRVVAELLEGTGKASTEAEVSRALSASMVMSADVIGAAHAQYADLYDPKNAAFLGAGVVWDRSAVHAEVMSYVRTLLDQNGITHQPATWIKSQTSSSGGTVLPFFTRHGMSGLDVSIPLLSMHAPYEVLSKADLYEAYRAYRAFLSD